MSSGLLILLGSYVAWSGAAFVLVYTDYQQRSQAENEWGVSQWALVTAIAGGLALPFYYWNTRGTSSGLLRGILLGLSVAVFAFVVRISLSFFFKVPVL